MPRAIRRYDSLADRILGNIREEKPPFDFIDVAGKRSPCWIWQGKRDNGGRYGLIVVRKPVYTQDGLFLGRKPRNLRVHRVSLHAFRGFPLDHPDFGCHQCSEKLCCNPFHLQFQTNSENQLYYNRVEKLRAPVSVTLDDSPFTQEREPGCDD